MTAYYVGRYFSVPIFQSLSDPIEPLIMIEEINNMVAKSSDEKLLQGFSEALLIVNSQLRIEKPVNLATVEMFNNPVENKSVLEVLFSKDESERLDVERLLRALFSALTDEEKLKTLQLLPVQVHNLDRFLKLNYHLSEDLKLLYIYVSDNSSTMALVEEAEDKIDELEMVVAVLNYQKEYIEFKQKYKKFINEDIEQFFSYTDELISFKNLIRHTLHVIKLDCIKLKFNNTIKEIENLEEAIELIGNDSTLIQFKSKLELLNVHRLMEGDQKILSKYINEEVLDAKYLTIDYEALMEVEKLVRVLPESTEKSDVLNRLNRIRYISIVDVINRFEKYAKDLSKRINKKINTVQFVGPNVLFDEDKYKEVITGFIELVTNAMEHGIEFPADRYRNNKTEHGNIKVTMEEKPGGYLFSFEDDGRGVDINGIKEILYETKRFAFDEIVEMSDQEVIDCIFLDGISTYVDDNQRTIKGTGLYMFKEKVENSGGSIRVQSEINKFTKFEVFLPVSEE